MLSRIFFKVDISTKKFINDQGFPLKQVDLPRLPYGTETILCLKFYTVDLESDTPLTIYPFDANALLTIRGDHDLSVLDDLMFLTEQIIGTPSLWQATTAYNKGDRIISSANDWFICTVAGTTSGIEPTWDTVIGNTTIDGTVTWQRITNNDGVNQPNDFYDWDAVTPIEKTADPTLGEYSARIYTGTQKFQDFMTSNLSIITTESKRTLIQAFILEPGNTSYSNIIDSNFWAGGTVDSETALPSPGNPSYLNSSQIAVKYIDRDLLNLMNASDLTIASNTITRTSTFHSIIPESGTADNLETINGLANGEALILKLKNPATDIITLKHGIGNLLVGDGKDIDWTGYGVLFAIGDGTNVQLLLSQAQDNSARKKAVIDIVDNTLVPPTEVLGDRYILDNTGGGVNASWDGASINDIVEFNGSLWVAYTPDEGDIAYVDLQDKDGLFVDDGTPAWELRPAIITIHNNLSSIQGGAVGDYQHLTTAQVGNIATALAHVTADGKSHSDVVLNNSHRADNNNPHSTSVSNIVGGTFAQLDAKVTDASLVKSTDINQDFQSAYVSTPAASSAITGGVYRNILENANITSILSHGNWAVDDTNKRLTYTGGTPRNFEIKISASVSYPSGSGDGGLRIAKNGTTIVASEQKIFGNGGSDPFSSSLLYTVSLGNSDYIELHGTIIASAGDTLLVENAVISITEIK